MSYGDWAQWRRRAKRSKVVVYLTCSTHQQAQSCSCIMQVEADNWYASHKCLAQNLGVPEAGRRGAGLVGGP